MRSNELVDILRSRGTAVLTLTDAVRITGKPRKYTSLFLGRLEKRGVVNRIEKGKYYLAGTSIYTIASNMIYPSYISLLSAFRYYNLTTQIIMAIDIISTKRHKRIDNLEEHAINFINIDKSRLFGFYRDKATNAFIAYIEKAVIDSLYFQNPPYQYVEEAFAKAKEKGMIDFERLAQFATKMHSQELLKRLMTLMASAHAEHELIKEV